MLSIRMKEKDSIKCKEWERRRREKINDAFKNLSQLLPNYDPAKNIAKIDILEKSTEFVKEIRLSNSRLLSQQAESDEKCKLIKELQDEVNKLILRVKQLTTLLKQAKIAIPIGPHIKTLGKKKLKWSEKIGPENLENSAGDKSCITITAVSEIANSTHLKTTSSGQPNESNNPSSISQNLSGTGTNNLQQCPLKEPNLEVQPSESIPSAVVSSGSPTVNTTSSSPSSNNSQIKSNASNPPGTTAHLGKDGLLPSLNNKPTSAVPSAPITLPMQTIILTPCQVPPMINQNPQMITRIALGPTRILPRPADGALRKIAILPIRKPLPPKEKKRRNRKKKVPVVTAEAQVQTSKSNDVEASGVSEKATSDEKVAEIKESPAPTTSTSSENPDNSISKLPSSTDASSATENSGTANEIPRANETGKAKEVCVNRENIEMQNIPEEIGGQEVTSMEVDLPEVGEEVEISSGASRIITGGQHNEAENSETSDEVLMEGDMVTRVPEGDQNSMKSPDSISANKTLLDISSSTTLSQGQVALSNSNHSERKTGEGVSATIRKDNKIGEERSNGNSKSYELRVIEASDVERSIQPSELDRLIAPNQNTNSPMGDAVTGDKISECIARSIDLIDAPDGELMELADNWGDSTVNSPKSPISPTQMFLNMFPLLPRESIVSVSEGAQQGSGTGKSNFQYRSSFYIDAMLPDDPPPAPPPSNTVAVRDTSEVCGPGSKNSRQSTESNANPSMPIVSSITTAADPVRSILTMTSSSASLPTPSSVSHRPVNVATTLPQCSQKPPTLPIIPTSSVKSSSQKQSTLETTKSTLKSKISQPEAKESNKNSHPPVLPTSSSTSFLSDFNLFPEPLDFGNFHHLSLSQMSLTEDLFREVSRIRNPPDCQQSSANSISNTANLASNFQQFDFGNQFHYSHQPHQQTQPQKQPSTQSSTEPQNQYSIPDIMTNSSVAADSASRSHSKQINSNAQVESQHSQGTNQFYQPMNFTPSSMPDYSHQSHNSNLQTPRYDFNSEPTYNARQSNYHPFSQELPHSVPQLPQQSNQKQNSTSSNNSNKHQLFRPQDFNQSSVTGHHQTQNTHRSNISHVQQSQPSTTNKSNAISHSKQASSVSGGNSQNLPPPPQISSTMPQRQETSRKPNVSSSQSLSSNQPNSQPIIHQSYVTPPHPVQSQIAVQSKEQLSKQHQPYHVTGNSANASSEKQSRTNPNTAQVTSKDQQQSKGYSKSQSSKNSESSSSRKSSSTSCTRRTTNQGSSSGTNQPTVPQHVPQNVPRLPEPNQFALMNNTPLPIPSFPDFSLATNFHQQYETFPTAPHYHHQHHPPNNTSTSSQPNPVNHHQQQQRKSSSTSARHTPFYLQDVNPPCEAYNYPNTNTNPPQTINLNPVHSSTHHHHGIHGTTYNSNASSSQSKPPNYPPNNQSTTSVPHHSHNHPNYFPNPAPQNAPMYPSGYTHQNSPTSSARTHQHEPLSVNYNLNANPASRSIQQSSNTSSQQPGKISKSSSSASSQMQPNQTNYPSNSGENSSNTSMPSSRPVNWMTTDTSSRTNSNKPAVASSQSRSSQQPSAPANPFSVSKLVGNASGQSTTSSNTTNTSSTKPTNPSMASSTSGRCTNANQSTNSNNPTSNSSYCAESLIRKNPSTNTSSNPSWNNLNFSQIQQPNQHHSVPHQHNISNAAPYEIPHNDQFNFSGYHTTNFPQHGAHQYNPSHNNAASESGGSNNNNASSNNASSNNIPATGHVGGNPYGPPFAAHDQQQQHSQQPHHVHQSQYHHHFPSHNSNSSNHHLHQHHGTTSSVSNFNLSSIFPEINDKRGGGGGGGNSSSSNATGSNTGNASSQNSSNNNSCNYYATVHSRK